MSTDTGTQAHTDTSDSNIETNISDDVYLFDPCLIPKSFNDSLSSNDILFRPLKLADYANGVLGVLKQLTVVGDISYNEFKTTFEKMKAAGTYFIVVAESLITGNIVATATAALEFKFVHSCGSVSHIEDVVVTEESRGKNVGKRLINILTAISKTQKCYKVILDCSQKNVPFYEKCDFKLKELQMVIYFD